MKKAQISCPEVVLLKKHILVMSFIGKDHVPAPKLKDALLSSEDMKNAFYQVLHVGAAKPGQQVRLNMTTGDSDPLLLPPQVMQTLYQECNLVHADLSEYNILWFEGKVQNTLDSFPPRFRTPESCYFCFCSCYYCNIHRRNIFRINSHMDQHIFCQLENLNM